MQDSPRDQPTVVAILCAFVRDQTSQVAPAGLSATEVPTDIQAALTVVTSRDRAHDGSTTVVDFSGANLPGADLEGADLSYANLTGTNLAGADLSYANLTGADLEGTNLSGANLQVANLALALVGPFFGGSSPDLTGADLTCVVWPGVAPRGWRLEPHSHVLFPGNLAAGIPCGFPN
jgi:hypothetical protein